MKQAAALLAAALLLSPSIACAWTVTGNTDALDKSKSTLSATTPATAPIQQFDRSVEVRLVLSCINEPLSANTVAIQVEFAEPVTLERRWVRYRVDENPIFEWKPDFFGDGKVVFLNQFIGPEKLLAEIRSGKTLKVEFDLPWAGKPVVEFDVKDAGPPLAQLGCKKAKKNAPSAKRG